jgi:hypothetical protein
MDAPHHERPFSVERRFVGALDRQDGGRDRLNGHAPARCQRLNSSPIPKVDVFKLL